jgi:hypothetical protein
MNKCVDRWRHNPDEKKVSYVRCDTIQSKRALIITVHEVHLSIHTTYHYETLQTKQ